MLSVFLPKLICRFSVIPIEIPTKFFIFESESCSVMSDSLPPHGLYSPWNSPGQNTGVVAIPFSRGSSQPRDLTQVSHIAGGFFNSWDTGKPKNSGVGSLSLSRGSPWLRNQTGVSCIAGDSLPTELSEKPTPTLFKISFLETGKFILKIYMEIESSN